MKKDEDFFPRACDMLGIDHHADVVFVDDTAENVDSARRFGWIAVHYTGAVGWRAEISAALSLEG
jgi:HAD superfamily hydrolase (TIGR01509 family)